MQIESVITDVFDTLLLRKLISERRRAMLAARAFAAALARSNGRELSPKAVYWARRAAQSVAFKALRVRKKGEVRQSDLIERQLGILGLPSSFAELLEEAELEIERGSVYANVRLLKTLETHRDAGAPIIAISDTMLTSAQVQRLIADVTETFTPDAVYSSADEGKTKRGGDLFAHVIAAENLEASKTVHFGNDNPADRTMALDAGLTPCYRARPQWRRWVRRIDSGVFEFGRSAGRNGVQAKEMDQGAPDDDARERFGHDVFGPIIAEACVLLWLYFSTVEDSDDTVALFCARGGLLIRRAYEIATARLDLPAQVRRSDFMVSRVVAARAALARDVDKAVDEVAREFRGSALQSAITAIAGDGVTAPEDLNGPLNEALLVRYLKSSAARDFWRKVAEQTELFIEHIDACAGNARRCILVDTGLYGSTQRMLRSGAPQKEWESALLARCNYKKFDDSHFDRTVGLLVEAGAYRPFILKSVILRYWQLFESLFEPALESVRFFERTEKGVISNLEKANWRVAIDTPAQPMTRGMLRYLGELGPQASSDIGEAANDAWRRLRRIILFPNKREVELLAVRNRSRDFGRSEIVPSMFETAAPKGSSFDRLKKSMWKEGQAVISFPASNKLIQALIEAAYVLRAFRRP